MTEGSSVWLNVAAYSLKSTITVEELRVYPLCAREILGSAGTLGNHMQMHWVVALFRAWQSMDDGDRSFSARRVS